MCRFVFNFITIAARTETPGSRTADCAVQYGSGCPINFRLQTPWKSVLPKRAYTLLLAAAKRDGKSLSLPWHPFELMDIPLTTLTRVCRHNWPACVHRCCCDLTLPQFTRCHSPRSVIHSVDHSYSVFRVISLSHLLSCSLRKHPHFWIFDVMPPCLFEI